MPNPMYNSSRRLSAKELHQILKNLHRIAISSQNALVTLLHTALRCPHASRTFFTLLSTLSNDLDENISDIVGGREHLSFSHYMACHQQFGIHRDSGRTLASIPGSELCASYDRGPHLHLAARSSHDMICR
jgi:hypothetical protein